METKRAYQKLPVFKKSYDRNVSLSITLDTRNISGRDDYVNVAGRVQYNKQTIYLKIDKQSTIDKFQTVCDDEAAGERYGSLKERKFLNKNFEAIKEVISTLQDEGIFSFDNLREQYTGISKSDVTIYTLWEDVIKTKSAGTADSYSIAFKRFRKDNGDKVKFANINSDFVKRWQMKMAIDLGITSIGIYLRTFRVIVNEAKQKGYIKGDANIFGFKDSGINRSSSRKQDVLSPQEMTRLYNFFITSEAKDNERNDRFYPDYKKKLFKSLGLFLFMYLADGLNLADAARLKYDEYYFKTGKKQMKFQRHKTKQRSDDSEVVFPILPQIKEILSRTANEERKDGLVFPILQERMKEADERRVIAQENCNIRKRVQVLCKVIGIEQQPSPTWCRHSFATNLTRSGVPKEYISESMGHSTGDVTSRYIDMYEADKMIEYNSRLLIDKDRTDALSKLASLDKDTLNKLLIMADELL